MQVSFRWPQSPGQALPYCSPQKLRPASLLSGTGLQRPKWQHSGPGSFGSTAAKGPREEQSSKQRDSAGWNTIAGRPPRTRSCTWLPTYLRVQGEGCRTRTAPTAPCTPTHARRIPAAGRIAELWGQAWPSGMQGHPACSTASLHPRPGDTHQTEP